MKFQENIRTINLRDVVLDNVLEFFIELISEHELIPRDVLTQALKFRDVMSDGIDLLKNLNCSHGEDCQIEIFIDNHENLREFFEGCKFGRIWFFFILDND